MRNSYTLYAVVQHHNIIKMIASQREHEGETQKGRYGFGRSEGTPRALRIRPNP